MGASSSGGPYTTLAGERRLATAAPRSARRRYLRRPAFGFWVPPLLRGRGMVSIWTARDAQRGIGIGGVAACIPSKATALFVFVLRVSVSRWSVKMTEVPAEPRGGIAQRHGARARRQTSLPASSCTWILDSGFWIRGAADSAARPAARFPVPRTVSRCVQFASVLRYVTPALELSWRRLCGRSMLGPLLNLGVPARVPRPPGGNVHLEGQLRIHDLIYSWAWRRRGLCWGAEAAVRGGDYAGLAPPTAVTKLRRKCAAPTAVRLPFVELASPDARRGTSRSNPDRRNSRYQNEVTLCCPSNASPIRGDPARAAPPPARNACAFTLRRVSCADARTPSCVLLGERHAVRPREGVPRPARDERTVTPSVVVRPSLPLPAPTR
ncbi:hypothetical protein FB451DRAFT_1187718 [Mycena latifolia]|nr:hypothetical protein FB451DRAFT_1187718 [Mycena latifolia]